jgi:hypothetical protein
VDQLKTVTVETRFRAMKAGFFIGENERMSNQLFASDNHLLALARTGELRFTRRLSARARRIIEKLYPIVALGYGIIALVLTFICAGLVFAAMALAFGNVALNKLTLELQLLFDPTLNQALSLVIVFTPMHVWIGLWLWLIEQRSFWTVGFERQGFALKYARGALLGFVLFSVAVGLFAVMGYAVFEESNQPTGFVFLGSILVVFLGWMVQGAAEEVLTRGFLLPVISARYGTLAGIALSSLLFMLLHSFNPSLSVLAFVNLFLFGVFASLYALREGGLWGVCALHSVWNWTQGNLYGLEVSGGDAHTATLINLKEVGPDWLTGGAFGPEGGLAVTIVLVVGCMVVWWVNRSRARS